MEVKSKNINNFTYQVMSRCIAGIKVVMVIPLTIPKLKLSCRIIILTPHDTLPCATQLCVAPDRLSPLSQSAILFIGRAPRPQALILLKIAPAARTYGLHLFSEAFLIFLRLFLFPMWWKENSDKINKMHIQGDVFHFPKNAFKHY